MRRFDEILSLWSALARLSVGKNGLTSGECRSILAQSVPGSGVWETPRFACPRGGREGVRSAFGPSGKETNGWWTQGSSSGTQVTSSGDIAKIPFDPPR